MIELVGVNFTVAEFIGLCLFAAALLVQLFYLILIAKFIFGKRKRTGSENQPSVSIIVTSRNYLSHLEDLIPALLEQDYPDFEVVVVDDCSSDGTEWYLKELKMRYANLKTTQIIQETDFPNALAITVGIRAASKEWLIFLTPLCRVSGSDWLKSYAQQFTPKKDAIVGYVNYSKAKGSSKRTFRYENFYSFLLFGTARALGLQMPISENNMAYRRETFLQMKGFAAVLDSPFSENELFLNKIAGRKNSAFQFNPSSSVHYIGEADWIDAVNFKKKQLLIKRKFSFGQRFFLSFNAFSRLVIDVLVIVLAILSPWRFWVAGAWTFVLILETIWLAVATKRLGERNMLPGLLFYNAMSPFINGSYVVNQLFTGQKRKWK